MYITERQRFGEIYSLHFLDQADPLLFLKELALLLKAPTNV